MQCKNLVDGYNYLKQAGISEDICQMVLKHHEKKSGKDYATGDYYGSRHFLCVE